MQRVIYINVASTTLAEKLDMNMLKHTRPYKLQWLDECGEVKVNKEVLVNFIIGRGHSDEVMRDIVPMHARHILLGMSQQYNRKVIYDKFKNRYNFVKDEKIVTLVPLTLKQVYEEQVKLKYEVEKKMIDL